MNKHQLTFSATLFVAFSSMAETAISDISLYKDNYILPLYHEENTNQNRYASTNPNGGDAKPTFTQFQFSIKYPLIEQSNAALYVAYTQKSNWDTYGDSAYFRDNDYNPEIFYEIHQDNSLKFSFGLEHQSNGEGGENEVSWNRAYAKANYKFHSIDLFIKPWVRIPDKKDYNPDIVKYLGYGEFGFNYRPKGSEGLNMKLLTRNIFRHEYYAISASYPMYKDFRYYIKLESGYGSSISNYNHRDTSYGVGISLGL